MQPLCPCFFFFPIISASWPTKSTTNLLSPEISFQFLSESWWLWHHNQCAALHQEGEVACFAILAWEGCTKVRNHICCWTGTDVYEVLLIPFHVVYIVSLVSWDFVIYLLGCFLSRVVNRPSDLLTGQQYYVRCKFKIVIKHFAVSICLYGMIQNNVWCSCALWCRIKFWILFVSNKNSGLFTNKGVSIHHLVLSSYVDGEWIFKFCTEPEK